MALVVVAVVLMFFGLLGFGFYLARQGIGVAHRKHAQRADALILAIREQAYEHAEIDHPLSTVIRDMTADYMAGRLKETRK